MQVRRIAMRHLIFGRRGTRSISTLRRKNMGLFCEPLEGRVTPAHMGFAHHAVAHLHHAADYLVQGSSHHGARFDGHG